MRKITTSNIGIHFETEQGQSTVCDMLVKRTRTDKCSLE